MATDAHIRDTMKPKYLKHFQQRDGNMIVDAGISTLYRTFRGARHDVIIRAFSYKTFSGEFDNDKCTHGFFTDTGEFLTRKEARHHAFNCGQVTTDGDVLVSEQVW